MASNSLSFYKLTYPSEGSVIADAPCSISPIDYKHATFFDNETPIVELKWEGDFSCIL